MIRTFFTIKPQKHLRKARHNANPPGKGCQVTLVGFSVLCVSVVNDFQGLELDGHNEET
jgi:hypothetical protein